MATIDDGGLPRTKSAFPTGSTPALPIDRTVQAYWTWAVCGLLLLTVGLVFGQTLGHEFTHYDDQVYVYENPHVTPGLTLDGLWWALTNGPFGEWFPLTSLSHMLDCQLYGVRPAGHYLTNVLLHAASSVLLFLVLLRMTGRAREPGEQTWWRPAPHVLWPCAWVAAIFAIHPLHVESVVWLAERRDVLSGLFFMLTLGAYALYAERPSLPRYLAVAGMLALGLMAKPILVTVPFLLLLLDHWPLDRFRGAAGAGSLASSPSWFGRLPLGWRLAVEKIPLLGLSAASCAIVVATHSTIRSNNPVERLSWATRLANGLVSYATYLIQSFYPVDLAPFYPHLRASLPTASVAGSFVLLVAITAIAIYCWRKWPFVPVGWFWYLGMLVPVIGLVQIGGHGRADRYTYLSQIGLSIALAWSVSSFYQSRQSRSPASWRGPILAVASATVVLLLAIIAWRQTSYWRNPETLWMHTLASTENNPVAHHNLGIVYFQQERTEEAISQLREATAIDAFDPQLTATSQSVLAEALAKQGRVDEALQHFEEAVRIYPQGMIFHAQLGDALAKQDKYDRAIAEWREAVRLEPSRLPIRLGLAKALLAGGNFGEAAAECRQILDQQPNVSEVAIMLGKALAAEGKPEDAIPHFKRALELNSHSGEAHFRLGLALYELGRSQNAVEHLDEAARLQPDDVPLLRQTAWILATSADRSVRRGPRAVELASRAVRLSGGQDVRALDALAAALAETEDFPAAVEAAEHASAMALTGGDDALAGAIEQRLRLYRQNLPYLQPAPTGPARPTPPRADE